MGHSSQCPDYLFWEHLNVCFGQSLCPWMIFILWRHLMMCLLGILFSAHYDYSIWEHLSVPMGHSSQCFVYDSSFGAPQCVLWMYLFNLWHLSVPMGHSSQCPDYLFWEHLNVCFGQSLCPWMIYSIGHLNECRYGIHGAF
jgi:hypothetical protein